MNKGSTTIIIRSSFEAAHRVELEDRGMENPHGHSWGIVAKWDVQKAEIKKELLRNTLKEALEEIDHTDLNRITNDLPTTEFVARMLFNRLEKKIENIKLISIEVEEEPGSSAVYYGS